MNQGSVDSEASHSRETRTTRTRPALGKALLSLLEEKSFEQITVREITAHAEVGYATFFRHYADKEALLSDLAAQQISYLLAMALPILFTVDSRATTQALCAYVWEHRKIWAALLTGGAVGILKGELLRQTQQVVVNDPKLNGRIPADLRALVPVSGAIGILAWWLEQSEPLSVPHMAEIIDILVVTPAVTAAPGVKPSPE